MVSCFIDYRILWRACLCQTNTHTSRETPQNPPVIPLVLSAGQDLGDKLVAKKTETTLSYIHQDHLGGTSLITDSSGNKPQGTDTMKYNSHGTRLSGSVPTDRLYTGQIRDIATSGSELYYYNARYYDPEIGRFISSDTIVPDFANPQSLNRYSYCINNPLKYNDPTGHFWDWLIDWASIAFDIREVRNNPSGQNIGFLIADIALAIVPFVPAGVGPAVKGINKVSKIIGKGEKVVKGADKLVEGVEVGGRWIKTNESMSDFSRAYQRYIAGTDDTFLRNGVKFDGLRGNTLLEAKGKYAQFVDKTGKFYEWFSGKDDLLNQARKQLKAADGLPIEWHFADEAGYNATKALFEERHIEGILLIYDFMP